MARPQYDTPLVLVDDNFFEVVDEYLRIKGIFVSD
jgi:hypothetical protein